MIRQRTEEQVLASAIQTDAALAGGLTRDQVVALVIARNAWQVVGRIDAATVTADLLAALASPVADTWDAIFVRRARAELATRQAVH